VLTANDVCNLLPEIDKATVYRNLSYFVRLGVLKELNIKRNVLSYELVDSQDFHHHFICRKCNQVIKVHGIDADKFKKSLPAGTSIESVSLNLVGLCSNCNLSNC